MDNDTPQIPFKDRNFWPALFVFTLPWLADIIILGGANQAVNGDAVRRVFDAPMGLVLNALYAAAPFALMAAAMRPRVRVSCALWGGAIVTAIIWAIYAFAGRAAENAKQIIPDTYVEALEYVTPPSGELFLGLFIILMIWPCVVPILMGVAAKFKETPIDDGDMR